MRESRCPEEIGIPASPQKKEKTDALRTASSMLFEILISGIQIFASFATFC